MLDYIIVGQGIAGTALSYTLLQHNKKILVLDEEKAVTASKVAAGIYNPITGKKLLKTWQADLIFPFLENFYTELEETIQTRFFYPKNIYRTFHTIEEQNSWMARSADPALEGYVSTEVNDKNFASSIYNDLGGIEITKAGYVDVAKMLLAYQKYLQTKNSYQQAKISMQDVEITSEGVKWKGIQAKKMIFCNGTGLLANTYFDWLPFKLVKGELLGINIPACELKEIVMQGVFLLPLEEREKFIVGATYEWNDLTEIPTAKGKAEILEKLANILKLPYQIQTHKAGIRPTSKDRRPFIGLHPKYPCLGIFNGLGTKGVSLAPYYAHHFFECLENNGTLEKEVDISRYYS